MIDKKIESANCAPMFSICFYENFLGILVIQPGRYKTLGNPSPVHSTGWDGLELAGGLQSALKIRRRPLRHWPEFFGTSHPS